MPFRHTDIDDGLIPSRRGSPACTSLLLAAGRLPLALPGRPLAERWYPAEAGPGRSRRLDYEPRPRIERGTFRLRGGRSCRLSYRGMSDVVVPVPVDGLQVTFLGTDPDDIPVSARLLGVLQGDDAPARTSALIQQVRTEVPERRVACLTIMITRIGRRTGARGPAFLAPASSPRPPGL